MAEKMGTRYNFNAYTFKDEMINDGVLRVIEVFDNFDVNRPRSQPIFIFL